MEQSNHSTAQRTKSPASDIGHTPNMEPRVKGEKAQKTLVQAVNEALRQAMEADKRVLLLGEDIGVNGGVFRATDGLLETFGENRVFDTPIAESGIVGFSIGLAVTGFKPVGEIQFMGFIYPAINQLFAHLARIRNRTRGKLSLPVVIRMPCGGGIHAPEHHSESYEALLAHTPGLKVVIPSTPTDAKGLLMAAIRSPDPVIFLEPKRIYRAFKEEVPVAPYTLPLGKAKVVKQGQDVTIISYGATMRTVLDAEAFLKREGVQSEIIDVRTIVPLDVQTILQSVKKTGRAVIVHEAPQSFGVGAEISALISERALVHLLAPVQRVAGYDVPFPYAALEKYYLPSRQQILKAVQKVLDF